MQTRGKVPLERAISKLGIASRTQAREWILAGRIRVNGVIRRNPIFLVVPESARIELDGKPLSRSEWKTILLHKPRGIVTTHSDEKGRATVFSLPCSAGLHAVGRLDQATSGLLILTNDTRLSSWLTDPVNGVPRIYVVTVRGEISEEKLEKLREGIEDGGERLEAAKVELRKTSRKESHLTVELTEGKNREIRRMFSSVGNEVTRLKRVAFGGLELGDLESGKSRELTREEIRKAFPKAPINTSEPSAQRSR